MVVRASGTYCEIRPEGGSDSLRLFGEGPSASIVISMRQRCYFVRKSGWRPDMFVEILAQYFGRWSEWSRHAEIFVGTFAEGLDRSQ